MLNIIILVLIGLAFAKAAHQIGKSPYVWSFIGVIYFIMGKVITIGLTFILIKFAPDLLTKDTGVIGPTFQIVFGLFAGLFTAYFLGLLSGLKLHAIFKK